MIDPSLSLDLYRSMFRIRHAEETIREHYHEDDMKTPMHMSMGEEAIVVGMCNALEPCDQVLGTYRSHALYLAKTGETDRFFAEMYGKTTGCARGKAGSMHLSAPEHGLLCCSAVVASSIPVALGAAFANQYQGSGRKVAVFFGDGAIDEGVFWESVNFACLMRLPILFVCEDNGLAVHTSRSRRQGFASINDVLSRFDMNVYEEDTTDVEQVYRTGKQAIEAMGENGQPCFLRFHYYRYLEHVGIAEDFDAGYRAKDDFLKWLDRDPVRTQRDRLLARGVASVEIDRVEQQIAEQVSRSLSLARAAEFADVAELHQGVFGCE